MSVTPICQKCGTRRDKCVDLASHKRYTGWVAFWKPSRLEKSMQKTYGYNLENPKELADIQMRQWKTDRERGDLNLKDKATSLVRFETVADEWWTKEAIGEGKIKNPKRSELSRFNSIKRLFGKLLLSDDVPKDGVERNKYLTLDGVKEWILDRREVGIAINTVNRDIKPLLWITKYAVGRYIKVNPLAGLASLKNGNIHDRWMTEEEHPLLTKAAADLGDTGLVEFIAVGLNTGFRKGNLERLSARHIYDGLMEARQTKSGEPYTVPIAAAIEPLLRRLSYEHPTGPILDTVKIEARFQAAARKAGLYRDKKDPDRVTIHTLRHTFAVLYLERGGDIYDLSKLLGHGNVAITDKMYGRYTRKRKEGQAALMSTPVSQLRPMLKVI